MTILQLYPHDLVEDYKYTFNKRINMIKTLKKQFNLKSRFKSKSLYMYRRLKDSNLSDNFCQLCMN